MISAQVLLDSISPSGHRLTTFVLRYPKWIHGEFLTHRVFSRNASSARAVPVKKFLEEVRRDAERATPVWWGKTQAGMQAPEELPEEEKAWAKQDWMHAALAAAEIAERMAARGVHKQIVNRILEPFLHINVICSATSYMNFFGLRLDAAAQPEMRALAEVMWAAYRASTPTLLRVGEWHLPYWDSHADGHRSVESGFNRTAIKVSVARCARVSFTSFETGKISTIEEDLALYDKLLAQQPLHASPAEHQATPSRFDPDVGYEHTDQWANYAGWRQFRQMIAGQAVAPLPEGYEL